LAAVRYWVFDHNFVPGLSNHPAWWVIIFAVGSTRHAWGALDRYRDARWRGGGAPEFCLCHGRLLFYRAPFLLALSFAAGLPPLLSARLCHLYGRSSDDFGPLVTESGYREDLASRALACLVWRMRIIGRLVGSSFLGNKAKLESDLLRATLKLTDPGDFVFDRRGETVFRQRCFYPIIETFTKERIRRGLMADNTIQRCIDTRTCVAILPDDMPAATFRFLEQNYLPIGNRLRVAGVLLHSSTDGKRFDFESLFQARTKSSRATLAL